MELFNSEGIGELRLRQASLSYSHLFYPRLEKCLFQYYWYGHYEESLAFVNRYTPFQSRNGIATSMITKELCYESET